MVGVRLFQIFLVLTILGVIIYLLRLSHALKLEKRIAKFAITTKDDKPISLSDKIKNIISKIIFKFSELLNHSELLRKYAEKYNKYIEYEERDKKRGIDYVSFKFLLAFTVIILSFITCLFHKINFDIIFFLIIFLISFLAPDILLSIFYSRKTKKVEEDLLKAIIIMNAAFQSGRNIMQAIETVKNELEGPIQDEFKKMYLDINYGLSIEEVFNRFYERVKLEDAKYITSSLTLLNKTGGDITKIFALIEKSIFDRKNLRNELNSLTSSSRFVFKLLMVMPIVFILIIFLLNPHYFTPLFTTTLGIIILIFIVLLYILYILIIKKLLEVEI